MRGEEERERKEQEKSGATISIGAVMIHLVPLPLLAVAPLLGRLSLPLSLPLSIRLRPYVGSAASMLPSSRISEDFGCQVDK